MPEEFIAGYAISFDVEEHLMGQHDQSTHGNKFGTNDKGEKVLTYKGGTGGWKKSGKAANTAPKVAPLAKDFTTDALEGMDEEERSAFFASKGNDAWIKSLSPAQKDAIDTYTSNDFKEINDGLRSGGSLSPAYQAVVKNANSALLATSAPADMIVTRGVSSEFYNTLASHVGGTFVDNGFTSTTVNPIKPGFKVPTQITIKVFKGAPGAYVNPLSAYATEGEWLPPSGSHFVVTSASTSFGKNYVTMEYRGQPHIGTATASWHLTTITEANPKVTPASRSNKFIWQEGDVQWLTTPKKGNS